MFREQEGQMSTYFVGKELLVLPGKSPVKPTEAELI
jgi:hypothetical protein